MVLSFKGPRVLLMVNGWSTRIRIFKEHRPMGRQKIENLYTLNCERWIQLVKASRKEQIRTASFFTSYISPQKFPSCEGYTWEWLNRYLVSRHHLERKFKGFLWDSVDTITLLKTSLFACLSITVYDLRSALQAHPAQVSIVIVGLELGKSPIPHPQPTGYGSTASSVFGHFPNFRLKMSQRQTWEDAKMD